MSKISCLVILLALASSGLSANLDYMIIGDSITAGVDASVSGETTPGRTSYRDALFDKFEDDALDNMNPVGPNNYNPSHRHCAFRGAVIEQLTQIVTDDADWANVANGKAKDECSGWGTGYTPEVVIIELGTNNILTGTAWSASAPEWSTPENSNFFTKLNALIDKVQAQYSNADIFVCNITDAYSDESGGVYTTTYSQDEVDDYNAGVASVNSSFATELSGQGVTIIDLNSVISPSTETVDGLHPNSSGESDIADAIFSSLKDFYNW